MTPGCVPRVAGPFTVESQARLERALDALAAPSASHEQAQLREIFENETLGTSEKALALLERVEAMGLEPLVPPPTLPPIEPHEIHLVCWMGVGTASA